MPESEAAIKQVFPIEAEDFASAGEVSGKIKNTLKRCGIGTEGCHSQL